MRKTQKSRLEKSIYKTGSPQRLRLFYPKKRAAKDGLTGSPFKSKRLTEEIVDHSIASPRKHTNQEATLKTSESTMNKKMKNKMNTFKTEDNNSPVVSEKKTLEIDNNRRHSLRSLTLGRASKLKKVKSKSIFRSP